MQFLREFAFGNTVMPSLVFEGCDLRIDVIALLLISREFVAPIVGLCPAILADGIDALSIQRSLQLRDLLDRKSVV
jgi:hypothetical protein